MIFDVTIYFYFYFKKPQLISKNDYIAEIHHVTTEDGYILQLHRIAGGPKSAPTKGKKVCLLMHALMLSSAAFILSGANNTPLGV